MLRRERLETACMQRARRARSFEKLKYLVNIPTGLEFNIGARLVTSYDGVLSFSP